MVHEPIYLDLSSSSSDEDDEDHIRNRNGSTALLYLAEVFHMDMDEDDVRIIDKPPSNGRVRRQKKPRVGRAKLDDDDCCILDTDPGAAADAASDVLSPLNSDELVMTGEKGPVACRDFPHARYLCVHFPFKSTLHSKFCAQCHCYVCDSLAPCSLWGEGNSPNDHCHASEEPRWKSLRKVAKYGSVTSFAVPSTGAAAPAAGESRPVQTARIQTFPSCTPPSITLVPPSSVNSTGGGVVLPRVATTVKRDPLVIQLKGKGRGKASQQQPPQQQQPQHLAMRNARQLGVRRKVPRRIPVLKSAPRSTPPPPSGRVAAAADKSPVITPNPNSSLRSGVATSAPPAPRTAPNPNFSLRSGVATSAPPAPNPNPRHGRPTVPSTATPHRRSTRSANTLVVNKLREAIAHSKTRAAIAEPTEPLLPSLNTSSAPTPSPPRYDSTSSLRDQLEDHQPDGVAQGSRTAALENAAAATSGHEFGTVDIVAGPIEGWEMYAATAADFDGFAAAAAASPEHVPSSLHDVIRQMAADDYLWEPQYRWH